MSEATATLQGTGREVPRRWNWFSAGCWAVIEQGTFAASNFLMNVLLARWLTPHDYGSFTAVYAAFLLLGTVHSGLVTEPMLVFGPGKYQGQSRAYLSAVMRVHWLFAMMAGLLLAGAAGVCWAAGSGGIGAILLVMALAQPLLLLLWLMRQLCYVQGDIAVAGISSAGYLVLMCAGLWIMHQAAFASAAWYLPVMALSSLVVALWIARQLGGVPLGWSGGSLWHEITSCHWHYGRWAMASGVVASVPAILCYLVLPMYASLEQGGALRAMANIMMPAHLVNSAAANMLVPHLVRRRGDRSFTIMVRTAATVLLLAATAYWLAVGMGHAVLIHGVYGGRFDKYSNLLWLVGALPVLGAGMTLGGAVLRAMERPALVFYASAIAGGIAAVAGSLLIVWYGMWGAASANILNSVCSLACLWWLVFRARGEAPMQEASEERYAQVDTNGGRQ